MYTVAILPLLILALLVLGGVGAVVYLVVHALAGKKAGALAWVVTGLLVLLVGMALLGLGVSFVVPVAHEVKAHAIQSAGNAPHAVSGFTVRFNWLVLAIGSAAALAVIWAMRRGHGSSHPREESGGWGKVLLLGLVGLALVAFLSYQRGERTRTEAEATVHEIRQSLPGDESWTQLWQDSTKPRIQINQGLPQQMVVTVPQADPILVPSPVVPSTVDPARVVSSQVDPLAPMPLAAAAAAADAPAETDQAIAHLVTKIDALARDFATVAEQLSEIEKDDSTTTPARQVATAAAVATVAQAETNQSIAALVTKIDTLTQKYADVSARLAEMEKSSGTATQGETTATEVVAGNGEAAGGSAAPRLKPPVETAGTVTPASAEVATGGIEATGGSAAPRPQPPVESPPAWVDDPPKRVGDMWREVIAAGEYASSEECYRAADVYLLLATYDRLMQLVGGPRMSSQSRPELTFQNGNVLADGRYLITDGYPHDQRLGKLARIGIGIDFVRREIAKDEYVDTVDRSVGPMKTLYTLVEFDSGVDRELRRRWDDYERTERFAIVGVAAAAVLGLIGAVYGLLKIDTWTKGYYTKRLFIGVPAVIMAIIGLIALLNA